jgi:hypothetical protein
LFSSTGASFGEGRGGTIGRNGSILEVIDANDRSIVLRARTGKVGTVHWRDLQQKNGRLQLAYGYAMTIHTAQGSTAKEHIFAMPSGSKAIDGLVGYSANTRHQHAGYIVINDSAEQIDVRKRRPLNDARPVTLEDKWANVARVLSYQPEPDSATALRERAHAFRRGAATAFRNSLPPDPLRQSSRQYVSAGAELVRHKQQRTTLHRVHAVMRQAIQRVRRQVRRRVERVAAGIRQ